MKKLEELTGQESGIVIYDNAGKVPEMIITNWSDICGFPRLAPMGLGCVGFSEDLQPKQVDTVLFGDVIAAVGECDCIYHNGELDDIESNSKCKRWIFDEDGVTITVLTFSDWA